MTTPSPGTRSRLVRLTKLLSSFDERRKVNWADSSGSDLTAVKVVSPLPASAYIVSPSPSNSNSQPSRHSTDDYCDGYAAKPSTDLSFSRAVQLAAKPTGFQAGDSTGRAPTVPRGPPPPVSLQPLPDTAVPRLAAPPQSQTHSAVEHKAGCNSFAPPRPPNSTAMAERRSSATYMNGPAVQQPVIIRSPAPKDPLPAAARGRGRSGSPGRGRHHTRRMMDVEGFTSSNAPGTDAESDTAFSRALQLSSLSASVARGGAADGAISEQTARRGDSSFSTIMSAQSTDTARHSLMSETVPAPQPPQPSTDSSKQRINTSSVTSIATLPSSRNTSLHAQERVGGGGIRTLRPAAVLLGSSSQHDARSSQTALSVGLGRVVEVRQPDGSTLAVIPRPIVRPLSAPPRRPEWVAEILEESDEEDIEPTPPWIPPGIVGAAETKHRLVHSPDASPSQRAASPQPARSPSPPRRSYGEALQEEGVIRASQQSPQVARKLERDETRGSCDTDAATAQPYVLQGGKGGRVLLPAVAPLPPPPKKSAALAIRDFLRDSQHGQGLPYCYEVFAPPTAAPMAQMHQTATPVVAVTTSAQPARTELVAAAMGRDENVNSSSSRQNDGSTATTHDIGVSTPQKNRAPDALPRPYTLQRQKSTTGQLRDHARSRSPQRNAKPKVRSTSIALSHDNTAREPNHIVYRRLHSTTPDAAAPNLHAAGSSRRPNPAAPAVVRVASPPPQASASRPRTGSTPSREVVPSRKSSVVAVAPAGAQNASDVVEFVRALVNLLGPAATTPTAKIHSAAAKTSTIPLSQNQNRSRVSQVRFALPPRLDSSQPKHSNESRFAVLKVPAVPKRAPSWR